MMDDYGNSLFFYRENIDWLNLAIYFNDWF